MFEYIYAEQELINQLGLGYGIKVQNKIVPGEGTIIGVADVEQREGDEMVTYTKVLVRTDQNEVLEWYVGNCIPV